MNLEKLKNQLRIDEGLKLRIYFCTKGYPTMGYGHKITKNDPEYYQAELLMRKIVKKVEIGRRRAEDLLENDVNICINNCKKIFSDFEEMPDDLQLILANMMFNMGLGRPKSDPHPCHFLSMEEFIKAVKRKDYKDAAKEMKDSLWYKEVKGRAARLTQEMMALSISNKRREEKHNVELEKNTQRV